MDLNKLPTKYVKLCVHCCYECDGTVGLYDEECRDVNCGECGGRGFIINNKGKQLLEFLEWANEIQDNQTVR